MPHIEAHIERDAADKVSDGVYIDALLSDSKFAEYSLGSMASETDRNKNSNWTWSKSINMVKSEYDKKALS